IMGMVDLTLDETLSAEQRENLLTVKDAADTLLNILNDILDLSRVEAGKLALENIEFDLREILKNLCKGLAVLAQNKNLSLQWQVDENVPKILIGDAMRLRQVLMNVINNAIKFTFRGKIEIAVHLKDYQNNIAQLEFSIKDQGVGIPQNKLDQIFESFTQADPSTTRRFGGAGLGLAISKKLVDMMGGKIWVESKEGEGSVFHLEIPYSVLDREFLSVKNSRESFLDSTGKSFSILLAEDNAVNQKMTVRMLEKKGWSVKAVENGRGVLECLAENPKAFDLILMDAQMPVLDGFEATRRIREQEKTTGAHIPIVALTARAMTSDQEKCLECGMDGHISKPIDREHLYQMIEKFLAVRSPHEK
ncbi:MAG: ATP-binding protein, partial [Candidatus Omnitrophica bacterium]|nr:ATP-binding protein [Candidatus Omnitrophota bacterium]